MILERDLEKMTGLCEKQRVKIQRIQTELRRLKNQRGIADGTYFTVETYNSGRAFLIRKNTKGDGSEIVCYPASFDAAVERWLQLQVGAGIEVASLADFQRVVGHAKDQILEQILAM